MQSPRAHTTQHERRETSLKAEWTALRFWDGNSGPNTVARGRQQQVPRTHPGVVSLRFQLSNLFLPLQELLPAHVELLRECRKLLESSRGKGRGGAQEQMEEPSWALPAPPGPHVQATSQVDSSALCEPPETRGSLTEQGPGQIT